MKEVCSTIITIYVDWPTNCPRVTTIYTLSIVFPLGFHENMLLCLPILLWRWSRVQIYPLWNWSPSLLLPWWVLPCQVPEICQINRVHSSSTKQKLHSHKKLQSIINIWIKFYTICVAKTEHKIQQLIILIINLNFSPLSNNSIYTFINMWIIVYKHLMKYITINNII